MNHDEVRIAKRIAEMCRSLNLDRTMPVGRIDRVARAIFETDTEAYGDREKYENFDAMPPSLQDWWRDRAVRKAAENNRSKKGAARRAKPVASAPDEIKHAD